MFEIIPGILEKDWIEIEKKINLVKPFAKTIHIDIIDGKFASNITFLDPAPFAKYTNDIFFELHMMVENPIQYLKPWALAGFKRFLGHVESLREVADQEEFAMQGQLLGEVGLAIDGPTDLSSIKVPYEDLDAILVYTSNKAGFSGPPFVEERLEKVKMLKLVQHDTGTRMQIEVDGGINDKTIIEAKNAGAIRFIINSFIFNSNLPAGGPQKQYTLLQERIHK